MIVIGSSSYALPYEIRKGCSLDIDLLCSREEFKHFHAWLKNKFKVLFLELKEHGAVVCVTRNGEHETQIIEITFEGEGQFAESNKILKEKIEESLTSKQPLKILYEEYGPVHHITMYGYYWQKMSHRFLKNSKHFNKTRNDILAIREYHKSVVGDIHNDSFMRDEYNDFYQQRLNETYGYKHPNLNQKKSTFFTDEVGYIYDHDDIHEAVKMLDKPAYQYYIEPGQEVKCSRELFDNLPDIVKLYGVLEESYVLALERAVIPLNVSADKAFEIALEKVCTSITSGWFREFAWENYDEVKKLYHDSYVNKFNNALVAGKVRGFREDEICF
jgi:hypothetical protein